MSLPSRVVLCALMAPWGGCYIQLDIHPETVHLDSSRRVTIRCSLSLTKSRTEKVYSIMLKKEGATVAVLFQDEIRHMTNRYYDVTGSVTTKSSPVAFIQISLDNVTCLDRGNYSCIMAMAGTSMEPVTASLEIQGKPSDISVSLTPDSSTHTEGDVVTISCHRLWTSKTALWSWTLPDGHEYTESSNCTYNESECIYTCVSSRQYTVTMHDSGSHIRCQTEGLMKIIRLNLSSTSQKNGMSVNTTTAVHPTHVTGSSGDATPPERDGRGMLTLYMYVLAPAFAVVLMVTLLCLFSDRKCKWHNRTLKSSMTPRDTFRSERHRRRRRVMIVQSRDLSCPHPNLDSASDETGYRDGSLHPQGVCPHPQGGYLHPQGVCPHPQGGYLHPQGVCPHPQGGYLHPQGVCPHPQGGYLHPQDGYPHPQGGYLHPQDTADSTVSGNNEHVYDEID